MTREELITKLEEMPENCTVTIRIDFEKSPLTPYTVPILYFQEIENVEYNHDRIVIGN